MRSLWPFAFLLSVPLWAQGEFSTPSQTAEAPDPLLRQQALHQVLSHHKLSEPTVQTGVINLLNRETSDTTEYHNKDAWHATLYSNYNENSPFGLSLAAEPEAFPFLLELASDLRSFYAGRGTRLLAEALARCYAPGVPNCSAVLGRRQQLLTLIRERIASREDWLQTGAIIALGVCGTKDDIAFLKERYRKLEGESAADEHTAEVKQATLGLLNDSIKKIEDRETQPGFSVNAH